MAANVQLKNFDWFKLSLIRIQAGAGRTTTFVCACVYSAASYFDNKNFFELFECIINREGTKGKYYLCNKLGRDFYDIFFFVRGLSPLLTSRWGAIKLYKKMVLEIGLIPQVNKGFTKAIL